MFIRHAICSMEENNNDKKKITKLKSLNNAKKNKTCPRKYLFIIIKD